MDSKRQGFPLIFSVLECVLALVCLFLVRLGGFDQSPMLIADRDTVIPVAEYNSNAVVIFAAYGNFTILCIQLITSLAGDRSSLGVGHV